MNPARRLRVPVLLTAALVALLVFAATAAAETRTGESASPVNSGSPSPETTLIKASASYETTSGAVGFNITTAAEPQANSEASMIAGLFSVPTECGASILSVLESEFEPIFGWLPLVFIINEYEEPTAEALVASGIGEVAAVPVAKTVSGTTTILSFTSGAAANKGYNCALVVTEDAPSEGEGGSSFLAFPISAPSTPAPAPQPTPAPAPPAPAPAVLSITKSKPLKLKADKWKKVKVKVTNTGGTATAQGSLRVKPAKGVHVKPEVQKLPVLAPGASWTVSAHVQLTEKAKKKSKLHLTATAPGATTAKGLLVVKLKS